MVDISRINPEDPNTLKQIIDRLTALEKQVKAIPDSLPPERGLAQTTRQGYMSKEQVVALNNATVNIAALQAMTGASYIQAQRLTAQTFTNANWTTILYDTEEFDRLGEYDPTAGIFTMQVSGIYTLTALLAFPLFTANARIVVSLWDASNELRRIADKQQGTGALDTQFGGSATFMLNAGVPYRFRAIMLSGAASFNSAANATSTYMSVARLF